MLPGVEEGKEGDPAGDGALQHAGAGRACNPRGDQPPCPSSALLRVPCTCSFTCVVCCGNRLAAFKDCGDLCALVKLVLVVGKSSHPHQLWLQQLHLHQSFWCRHYATCLQVSREREYKDASDPDAIVPPEERAKSYKVRQW